MWDIRSKTMIRIRKYPDVIKIYAEGEYRELNRQDIERLKEVMEVMGDLRDVKEIVIYGNRIELRSENYAVHLLFRNLEDALAVVAEALGLTEEELSLTLFLAPKIIRVEKLR